ncbi:MAG TPA: NHLP bacteriocin export ABC transporter permease/ATPase subunit [Acidimicrobiales bacterium]
MTDQDGTTVENAQRPLLANAPLWMDDPSRAWRVESGRVQVFALLGEGSRRIPVAYLEEGDWALPAPLGSEVQLLLVSLVAKTIVSPVALPAETDGPVPPRLADREVLHAIESWVERLAQAVGDPSPAEGVGLVTGERAEMSEGQVAWPVRRSVWIDAGADLEALRLFGDTGFADGGQHDGAAVPLPASAWIRADRASSIVAESGAQTLARPEGWRGLQLFCRAALSRLQVRMGRAQAAAGEALAGRDQEQMRLDTRIYTQLSRVLEPSGDRLVEPDTDDPTVRALSMVAASTGVEIRSPEHLGDVAGFDRVDAIARSSGLRWRRVALEGRWWRQDVGALYGTLEDGKPVALLPRRAGSMDLVDPADGTTRRVDASVAERVSDEAAMLYRSLPRHEVSGRGILGFLRRSMGSDLWRLALLGLAVGVLSLITPLVTKYIFSTVVPGQESGVLFGLTILLIVFAVGSFGFSVIQRQALARISGHVTKDLQSALCDRVVDLPLSFFRRYSSGSLARRVMAVDQIQALATAVVTTSMLAVPIGIFNLGLAFYLQPRLGLFALLVIVAGTVGIFLYTRTQSSHLAAQTEANQHSFGLAMQFVDGVGKLRVANAERRAFAQWATSFGALKEAFVASQRGFAAVTAFTAATTAVGTAALFLAVATLPTNTVSSATFIAFNTAFGQSLAALAGLTGVAVFFAQARPLYDSARPVLETPAEVTEGGEDPGPLSGAIEVSHLGFRYTADGPAVLDDVSFQVDPGAFVALVGPSGSGKSSVMRLLLGLEMPEVGTVRYDGKDLDSLDLVAVRRQIGVATQSVRLLPGDVFTNIVGNRELTMDDAWEAAEVAGIADDIRDMPMQMNTFISEGASTFSGGQRQRLLLARAVVAKPKILLLDEATSALDNRTQAQVAEAIARLRAARVVIAHRLSTIREADTIMVLDQGTIVEQGNYDELMATGGRFAELALRQLS